MSIVHLISWFNQNLLYKLEEYHSIDEVMNYYQIPLFEKFDFYQGYNMVKKDNIVFIKLLFKDIDRWPVILTEIFKTKITKLINANLSENKQIFDKYNEFKKYIMVKKEYLTDTLSKNREFKIYNTPSQQKQYMEQWLNKSF
jgi:hypothetical protein